MKAEARVLRSALMFGRLRKQALEKEVDVKGFLGPSLRENPSVPSLGRRSALSRGLIVDDAGKLRCPAGTPNANQFTDLQMSNCMIPSAETAVNEAVDAIGNAVQQVANLDDVKPSLRQYTPSPDADRIRRRNDEVLSSISAQGGQLDGLTPEYIEREKSLNSINSLQMITTEKHTEIRKRLIRDNIEFLKRAALSRDEDGPLSFEETQRILTGSKPEVSALQAGSMAPFGGTEQEAEEQVEKLLLKVFGGDFGQGVVRRGVSPQVLKMLRESSVEDIELELERAARSFHDGLDPRVHVQVPRTRLASLFSDGRYKTTHEARSEHSGPDVRRNYEATFGIPTDASADVRPASGYVVHRDWQASVDKNREARAQDSPPSAKRKVEDLTLNAAPYGHVGIYGGVTLRLKPEVSGRTRYGWGDSFNNLIDPVAMTPDADVEEVSNALLSRRFKNGSRSENINGLLTFLDAHISGDFSGIRSQGEMTDGKMRANTDNNYAEALVLGSFSLEDIEEIEIGYDEAPWFPAEFFPQREYNLMTPENSDEFATALEGVFDRTISADRLRELGASDEEIEIVNKWMSDYIAYIRETNSPRLPRSGDSFGEMDLTQRLGMFISMQSMKEMKEQAAAKGIRMKITSSNGFDRWDISNYSEAEQKIGDVMKVWQTRVAQAAISDARRAIERRNRPAGTGSVDI